MTITASTKLAESDVKKMVNEAKQFEEQDRTRKEEVEARNTADSLIYTAEKTKTDLSGKLGTDILDRLNAAIVSLKAALEGKDTARIKSETEKLQKVLGEAGTAAYQEAAQRYAQEHAGSQAGSPGSESRQETTGPGGEKVVDADFKVKDEK
jgi:molecular chaperone DnaK